MAKKAIGLEELFVEELQDLLDVEKQLVRALPKMVKSATDEELGKALSEHLEVTKGQVERLERVFQSLDMRPKSKPCKGMKGIIEEGKEMLEENLGEALMDSAITGAARKVEHYEMMGYESACALAKQLGKDDAAQMLKETLDEETEADQLLAKLSKRLLKTASESAPMDEEGEKGSRRRSGTHTSAATREERGEKSSHATDSEGSHELTDREEIEDWAEERGAVPACVKGTGNKGDIGMLRLDFPGYSGEESLEEISWDDWFEKFEANGLALLVQETTAGGKKSNFNKLIKRHSSGTRAAH